MSKIKANKIESLASKLVQFGYELDWYEASDVAMTVEKTERELWDDEARKGIANYLKNLAETDDDDIVASEAYQLYREVVTL